jgi:hypothetical protein
MLPLILIMKKRRARTRAMAMSVPAGEIKSDHISGVVDSIGAVVRCARVHHAELSVA